MRTVQPVTPRAVLLGLALLPANAWWLIQIEYVRYSDTPTIPQVFFHCVAMLLALRAVNLLLERRRPAWALSPGELITVYAMLVIGSNIAGHDQLQILFTQIIYLRGQATPENQWEALIWPHVPGRLVVHGARTLDHVLKGHSTAYTAEHWHAFAPPLVAWGIVALVMAWTLYCLGALLRRQWENERLSYPLEEVPLALSDPDLTVMRRLPFWAGFALAAGAQLLNLASSITPAVPSINLGVRNFEFTSFPWQHMGTIPICFYPFALGLSFLLPTNLSFSCWFFFLLTRFERVVAAMFGYTSWDGFPYVNQQASGAFVGLGLLTLWTARHHLARTVACALGRRPAIDSGEPMSYRLAWVGFVAGAGALIGFTVSAGMAWGPALAHWVLLLSIILAVARVRAEVGLPSIELYQRGADDMLRRGAPGWLKPADLTVLTLFFWMHRTVRNYNLQHQMTNLRLANRSGVDLRSFGVPIALATIVGIPVAFWAMMHVCFDAGLQGAKFTGPAGWAFGMDAWQQLGRRLSTPQPFDRGVPWAYLFGAAMTGLLTALRQRFIWWPLHPAGWVVANSFALMRLWVPITVAWAIKSALLRYGGLRAYRAALPFFIGLVVGEFAAGLLRTLVDLAWGLHLPSGAGIGGL
ncbi:MAG: hypothetical protein HZB16_16105 [Armatimonadetes bacterium]|nr:hypothetical protein [Armatimonadota bacterium]